MGEPFAAYAGAMDILSLIDRVLAEAERPVEVSEPAFDEAYWAAVEQRPASCRNCGRVVEAADTSTGWTHIGDWQGVRCPGMLCGAVATK